MPRKARDRAVIETELAALARAKPDWPPDAKPDLWQRIDLLLDELLTTST